MQNASFKNLISKVSNTVKAYKAAQNGNMGMLLALSATPLIIAFGAAVDYSQYTKDLQNAQIAADSASLAAAVSYYDSFRTETAGSASNQLAVINHRGSDNANNSLIRTETTRLNDGSIQFKSSVKGTTQHAFMGIVGKHETEWEAVSYSEVSQAPQIEIMLVMDVSDSMRDLNKIDNLKAALDQFITDVDPYSLGDSHIAVTLLPYSENINFGQDASVWLNPETGFEHASSFSGCFRHDDNMLQAGDFQASIPAIAPGRRKSVTCPKDDAAAVLFSTDGDALKTQVNLMDTSRGTNTTTGLVWAQRFLTNQWRTDASFSSNKPENITDDTQKVIILLTDGIVTITDQDQNGELDNLQRPRPANESFLDSQTLPNFRAQCEAISQIPNLRLFSIGFDLNAGGMSNALRECVAGGGSYFDAGVDDLNAVFSDISRTVLPVRLTQ